tara:strand:- start:369 stop:485 length:117 start_codon:yes stop_codon:yes gene_type:complete
MVAREVQEPPQQYEIQLLTCVGEAVALAVPLAVLAEAV